MTIQQAKEFLESEGYFTANLWHIDDVMDRYECSEAMAQEILHGALTNDYIMEQINVTIEDLAEIEGL